MGKEIHKSKLDEFKSGLTTKSNWREEALFRRKNRDWLKKSQYVAIMVLKTLREKKMSQAELAEILGVTPPQVSKIVKGRENLKLETISKLENALNIVILNTNDYNKADKTNFVTTIFDGMELSISKSNSSNVDIKTISNILRNLLPRKVTLPNSPSQGQRDFKMEKFSESLYDAA